MLGWPATGLRARVRAGRPVRQGAGSAAADGPCAHPDRAWVGTGAKRVGNHLGSELLMVPQLVVGVIMKTAAWHHPSDVARATYTGVLHACTALSPADTTSTDSAFCAAVDLGGASAGSRRARGSPTESPQVRGVRLVPHS
jgi:hypothetical protein